MVLCLMTVADQDGDKTLAMYSATDENFCNFIIFRGEVLIYTKNP